MNKAGGDLLPAVFISIFVSIFYAGFAVFLRESRILTYFLKSSKAAWL